MKYEYDSDKLRKNYEDEKHMTRNMAKQYPMV